MNQFFKFFAERHTLANLITVMTILLGLNALLQINRDMYPHVDFGRMSIKTIYPGASPEDVELNVTNKIEQELKNIAGIDQTTSISMENASFISVMIDPDATNQEKVKDDVREAVSRVTDLPEEVTQAPQIDEWSTASHISVIEVGITGDVPYDELRAYAKRLEKKIRELPGVSRIDKFGLLAREIKVDISPAALKKYQIPLREVIWAIQTRNIRATAGDFESYTSEKNLVTLAEFKDPYEVGDVIVRATFEGPLIRINDLALVRDAYEEKRIITRMNGEEGISFIVYKSESADIIKTAHAVKTLVSQEKANRPEGINIAYSSDLAKYVSNRFDIMIRNLLIGLVFVVIILTLFLNLRMSFWVALGIPVSLLGVTFILPFLGRTLDSISLASMVLVIGIIVDDAIIIAENIYQRREKGDPPLTAAVNGIKEVYLPVLTTVLTTILAFAPMFFMSGTFGKFIVVIPLVVTLALVISLAEATVALPAHLVPGLQHHKKTTSVRQSWFDFLRKHYKKIVLRFLRLRYIIIGLFTIVLVVALWYGMTQIKFILFPSRMATDFYVIVELPTGNSLQASSDKARQIEELIMALPDDELQSFVTRIGHNPFLEIETPNVAALWVSLTPYNTRKRTADEIVEELRAKTDSLTGFIDVTYMIETGGPPVGRPISIGVIAVDDTQRREVADTVEAFLHNLKGVKDIQRDDIAGKDQVAIKVNHDKLARFGLTVADIAQNVRIAYDGEVVTSVRYGDEDVDFRVMFESGYREKLDYLYDVPIPNHVGRLIPLRRVATFDISPGPTDLRHFNGERTITISADIDQKVTTSTEASLKVYEHFDLDRDYPGVRFTKGGEFMETEESMASLYRTFIVAIIAIYFLLVLLFNSFTQPFMVIIAIPFGMIGVVIAFALHGEPMSFVGMMGVIGLAGVVVNDSLVLVSHINKLRKKEPEADIRTLVAQGTIDRLRAVILTTLTTVVGLLPLVYGLGGSDPFMSATALALSYGLFFATPLTLVLVPCLYVTQHDIERCFHKLFKRES